MKAFGGDLSIPTGLEKVPLDGCVVEGCGVDFKAFSQEQEFFVFV